MKAMIKLNGITRNGPALKAFFSLVKWAHDIARAYSHRAKKTNT